MIVFHHNDADGRCAAAIVLKSGQCPSEQTIRFIEMDYKMACPFELIQSGERVVIVDFSFKPDVMVEIMKRTDDVIWCDHHVTAKDYGYDVAGFRDFSNKGLSGCECTWKHFFPNDEIPPAVRLLGDYDAWRLEDQPRCFRFYEGLKLENQQPCSEMWVKLLGHNGTEYGNGMAFATEQQIVDRGKAAIAYRDNYCGEILSAFGYETEIAGSKAYAMNLYRFGSGQFGELFRQYPVCIAYIHDGAKFTVSLYSETVDVSQIAKSYGGGGHKGAAGFVCEALPWAKQVG